MRRKTAQDPVEHPPEATPENEFVSELRARGVANAFAEAVADHLTRGEELVGRRRAAVLDGVAVAFSAHQVDYETLDESAENIDEIQRLMAGFASELRKLEEGLRIVSAYVLRMHDKASTEVGKRVH